MQVVGYTDALSVAPGESLSLMVSSLDPDVDVSLVRLSGPAAEADRYGETVPSTLGGRYAASRQPLRTGSYVMVDDAPQLRMDAAFSMTLWVLPTLLADGEQTLISKRDARGTGWSLDIAPAGQVRLSVVAADGDRNELVSAVGLTEQTWYFVGAVFDGASERTELVVRPSAGALSSPWSARSEPVWSTGRAVVRPAAAASAPLLIAGSWAHDEAGEFVAGVFNGKIAMPRLFPRALTRDDVLDEADDPVAPKARPVAAVWDFSQGIDSTHVIDVSGNNLHGVAVQQPTRGATGPRWDGSVFSWTERPDLYDAIHFHSDDLVDAGWQPTVTWTVDADLPSGIYAARVAGSSSGEDHVPFVVRPPRDRATAPALFVAPSFSWLAYGNWRVAHAAAADRTALGRYVVENRLNGLYDRHTDASSVCYTSWRKPNLHLRPEYRLGGSPHQMSADLLVVDWLRHEGVDVDVVTDDDLHQDGVELLSRYQVVISGAHSEYWSGPMLDALAGYLDADGRYMYLSGNGLYRVTGFQPDGFVVEVRRQDRSGVDASRHAGPGEGHLSLTGEPGGAWRWRGRAPQRYVGVGMCGLGFNEEDGLPEAAGAPYRRRPDSFDPRARFIFDGVADNELIGAFPNSMCRFGAAGFELDRADTALGTPHHALVLATATADSADAWTPSHDDEEDRKTVASDVQAVTREVRADLVFFETVSGGAVFATGSIAWAGALSHNHYRNNVAAITSNVLRRFLAKDPFPFPVGH